MPNWCENDVLIRGPAEEIKRYKNRLFKDAAGKYYPWISTIPLPEFKDEAEVYAYIDKEFDNKTVLKFQDRVTDLEVIENNPEELELHLMTAYGRAGNLCTDDLYPKLSILHKYFEPNLAYRGFIHYVKDKVIASGYEDDLDISKPWQMYDYNPWPPSVNPQEEKLKDYIVITLD